MAINVAYDASYTTEYSPRNHSRQACRSPERLGGSLGRGALEVLQNRTVRALIPAAAPGELGECVADPRELGDLVIELGDVDEGEPLDILARAPPVAIEGEKPVDLLE